MARSKALFPLGLIGCWDPLPPSPEPYFTASTVLLDTADGATVGLVHYPSKGSPVLLVHGISSNHRFFALDDEHSLARWLAERGHDVWMLDLRGHGTALYRNGSRQITGWTVDDYGTYDVHAAVEHIVQMTGQPQVDYIGHSMGGMVGAIYLHHHGQSRIDTMVVLGSPAAFSLSDPAVKLAQAGLSAGGASLLWVESPAFGALAADMQPLMPEGLMAKLYNPLNYAPATITSMLRTIASPISRKEMQHFAKMLRDERFQSWDGKIDYRASLSDVTVPLLAFGSSTDGVVPEARVRAFAESMGGEAQFVALNAPRVQHGYGHLDYALGQQAPVEVFPLIRDWLSR